MTMYRFNPLQSESGSVMFIVLMIMVVAMIIGVTAINTSTVELEMSGNDALIKRVFYRADGQTNLGIELLEENIFQAGFDVDTAGKFAIGNIEGDSPNFYLNPSLANLYPCDNNRDCWTPLNATPGTPHGNLRIGGDPRLAPGSASQMAKGYEGLGGGAGGGGIIVPYGIGSQWIGERYANRSVAIIWRHVVGMHQ